MAVEIGEIRYLTMSEVARQLGVARQTLWRWRRDGQVPAGRKFRGKQIIFAPAEVEAIREYAYRTEPIADNDASQLGLFDGSAAARSRK